MRERLVAHDGHRVARRMAPERDRDVGEVLLARAVTLHVATRDQRGGSAGVSRPWMSCSPWPPPTSRNPSRTPPSPSAPEMAPVATTGDRAVGNRHVSASPAWMMHAASSTLSTPIARATRAARPTAAQARARARTLRNRPRGGPLAVMKPSTAAASMPPSSNAAMNASAWSWERALAQVESEGVAGARPTMHTSLSRIRFRSLISNFRAALEDDASVRPTNWIPTGSRPSAGTGRNADRGEITSARRAASPARAG